MFKKLVLFTAILCFSISLYAQYGQGELDWWTNKHNWDGHTEWFHMMTTSAAFLGPNALPVPVLRDGLVESKFSFEMRPEAHISKGDQTYNLFTSFIAPLGKSASFEVFLVPSEYYKMDTITRDERLARHQNAEGYAGGDFWFGTNIQLIRDKRFPDLMMSVYFKTASGTNLSDARYTDTPAYYLLLNAGKTIIFKKNKNIQFRYFGDLGVYIWQTWSEINSQDDAFLYGIGAQLQNLDYLFKLSLTGYHGYLNNGDRPAVLRMQLGTHNRHLNFVAKYQIGLHDYNYQSVGFSLIYQFSIKHEQ